MPRFAELATRVRVPLHFLLAAVYLVYARPTGTLLLLGAIPVLAGLALRAWAAGHLRRDVPVTTSGPYAHLRHPLYFGTALELLGFAIAGGVTWLAVLLAAYFLILFVPVIRREERARTQAWPDYAAYTARVPAFPPRLRAAELGSPSATRFAWALYRRNCEWRAAVGCAALFVVLAGKILWS